jgi:choline kinase
MKTLIIAAGNGTRLSRYTKEVPKPLIRLGKKPLIEIILDRCKSLGLSDFVIVTGYLEEKIKTKLKEVIDISGINVEFISNPEFDKENGVSVYCARNVLKNEDRFLIMMADHIFDSALLKKIINYNIKEGCLLAIDKNLSKIFDLQEATKVYEKNRKILDISKNLKEYNAVDTGFFLCTQDIFKALEKLIEQGFYKLSDAMLSLTKNRKLVAVDISGNFWLDVDTEKDLEFARKHFHF